MHAGEGRDLTKSGIDAATLIVAAAVLAGGLVLAHPRVAGFYHDDAIYLSTAHSLARGDGLRLEGVPGTPAATKYPPLYPLLLSGVWTAHEIFPDNLRALKAVNAVALAACVPVFGLWLARSTDLTRRERLAAILLTASAPGFLSFTDVVLAEPVFMLLCLGALAALATASIGWRQTLMAAVLASLAFLTRSVGVAMILGVLVFAWRRSSRLGLMTATAGLALCGPWLLWRRAAAIPDNELLWYYVRYEESAWLGIVADPQTAWRVLTTNVAQLGSETARVWGLGSGWLVVGVLPFAAVGSLELLRDRRHRLLAFFVLAYSAIVVGHPFPFARYLVPLTPFVMTAVVIGAHRLSARIGPIAWTAIALTALVHGGWLVHFSSIVPTGGHGEFGRPLPYRWTGFDRTATWLREHTPGDAVVASGHDQLYALYTGRKGVRPWYHPTAFQPLLHGERPSGEWLLERLRRLGVTHLVVDPLWEGPDGDYGRESIGSILRARGAHWRTVYEDPALGHVVYELVEP